MSTIQNLNSKSNTMQSRDGACSDCQKGNCCGRCWCCYDRDRRVAVLSGKFYQIEKREASR